MKRIFIAVKVNPVEELLTMMSSFKELLGSEKIKWVDPGNIHVTLAFLGDTGDKEIKLVSEILKEKCTGFKEFEFILSGTGIFRNFSDPRVIWCGIKSEERLKLIYNMISDGLRNNGFPVENKEFKPHLTLGRIRAVRNTENLRMALERYKDKYIQKVSVPEIILYESILMQTGPLYKPLGIFGL